MKSYQATYILEQFVDSTNRWNSIFGSEPITFPLSQKSANNLMDRIAGELSPENLHCDGEISHAEAMRKYNFLTSVLDELNIYCDANSIQRPTVYEA